ncbi:hypothetical protein SAMN05216303_10954 [Rhodoferax sp. OV413]|nr:hypothetical protein SAMN05216303_10954 [Rhodoferax sp. OV413]
MGTPRCDAVVLKTSTGELHGSLRLPTEGSPTPAVVLVIAGSGPTDRDGNSTRIQARNDSLKMLAQALAQAGVASLCYDKRGVAASAAAASCEADLRFDTYVEDAAAWIHMLLADDRFASVFVFGHSEGSLVGMLAAKESSARAFISVAGPGRRGSDVLRQQLAGLPEPGLVQANEAILSALEQGQEVPAIPTALASLYRPSVLPYLRSWFAHDPAQAFAVLGLPALVVQGTTDLQVGVPDALALRRAKPDAKLCVVQGMNHVLKMVPADPALQQAAYVDPSLPVAGEMVDAVLRFVATTPPRLRSPAPG